MDIYSKPGTPVKFVNPTFGYEYHQETARKHLKVGNIYTVKETVVDSWHTDVYLEEVPGVPFNSVLFDNI